MLPWSPLLGKPRKPTRSAWCLEDDLPVFLTCPGMQNEALGPALGWGVSLGRSQLWSSEQEGFSIQKFVNGRSAGAGSPARCDGSPARCDGSPARCAGSPSSGDAASAWHHTLHHGAFAALWGYLRLHTLLCRENRGAQTA